MSMDIVRSYIYSVTFSRGRMSNLRLLRALGLFSAYLILTPSALMPPDIGQSEGGSLPGDEVSDASGVMFM